MTALFHMTVCFLSCFCAYGSLQDHDLFALESDSGHIYQLYKKQSDLSNKSELSTKVCSVNVANHFYRHLQKIFDKNITFLIIYHLLFIKTVRSLKSFRILQV